MNHRISARTGSSDARLSAAEMKGIVHVALAIASAAGLLLAVAMLGRSLAGAPTASLSGVELLLVGLVVAAWQIASRRAWFSLVEPTHDWPAMAVPMVFPGLTALLLGASLTGIPSAGEVVQYWGIVVAAESWAWMTYLHHSETHAVLDEPIDHEEELEEEIEDCELPDRETTLPDPAQQFARFRAEDGSERVHGTLRATTRGGERSLSLHIAFCPSLATRPTITADLLCEAAGTVSIGQAEVFGARFDVRFSEAAEPGSMVAVEFEAVSGKS